MDAFRNEDEMSDDERAVHEQARAAAAGLRLPAPAGGAALTMRAADRQAARRRAINGGGVAVIAAAAIAFATLRVGRSTTDHRSPTQSPSTTPISPTSSSTTSPTPSSVVSSPERVAAAFRLPAELRPNLGKSDRTPSLIPYTAVANLVWERPECEPLQQLFVGYPETRVAYQQYIDLAERNVQVYLNVSTTEAESANIERIRSAGVTLFDGCLTAVMRSFRSEWSRAPSTLRKLPGLKVDDVYSLHSDEIQGAPGERAEVADLVHVRVGGARLVLTFRAWQSDRFTEAELAAIVEELADRLIVAEASGR
jgi:hypothetical protein